MSWLPSSGQWVAFLVASLVFVQVPGPSLLFTIGRALSVGRRPAQLSVVGNALGLVLQVVLVAVGLGALVAASATAFTALKLIGAVYVVWLGVQAIRHRADARLAMDLAQKPLLETPWQSVRTGVLVGSTNPKTVVFFVAFLPQFTDSRAGHSALQVLLLGLVFAVLAVLSDSVWVQVAGRAREWFTRRPHRLDRLGALGGAMMVGLGVTLAASD